MFPPLVDEAPKRRIVRNDAAKKPDGRVSFARSAFSREMESRSCAWARRCRALPVRNGSRNVLDS